MTTAFRSAGLGLSHGRTASSATEDAVVRSVLDALPTAVSVRDEKGRYVLVNRAAAEAIGREPEDILGRRMVDVFRDDPRVAPCLEGDRRVLAGAEPGEVGPEEMGPMMERWRAPLHVDAGGWDLIACFAGSLPGVPESGFAAAFQQFVERASDVLYRVDVEGRIVYANPMAEQLLGFARAELESRNVIDLVREDYRQQVRIFYSEQLAARTPNTFLEVPVVGAGGRERWLAQNVQLLMDGGRPVAFQAVAREITDRKELEAQLAHLATHDTLTELFNRTFFEAQVDLRLAQCAGDRTPGAVVLVDLDRFKEINDTFGHAAGDSFLREFALFLGGRFRDTDVVARLGGDEFAILLHHTEDSVVESMVHRLVEAVRRFAVDIEKGAVSSTVSVGVALFPEHGTRREALLGRADLALYQAKHLGRDRSQIYVDGWQGTRSPETRSSWVDRLREALERRDFSLHAQEIRDLRSGGVVYHETLLRLRHPDGKVVDAGAFLDLAEHLGLTLELDRWATGAAIDGLAEHHRGDVVLGINLSSRALASSGWMEWVRDRLRETGVSGRQLVFEIAESAAIDSLPRARQALMSLAALGCRFALDDFGVNPCSLHRLKQLPIDFLKIDGGFVRNVCRDASDRALVESLVGLARALGRETIAEFVEDEATLQALRRIGVDNAQGFHVGRNRSLAELLSAEPRGPRR